MIKRKAKLLETGDIIKDVDRDLLVKSVSAGMVRSELIVYYKDLKTAMFDWVSLNKEQELTLRS
jgi:hypothetical protein